MRCWRRRVRCRCGRVEAVGGRSRTDEPTLRGMRSRIVHRHLVTRRHTRAGAGRAAAGAAGFDTAWHGATGFGMTRHRTARFGTTRHRTAGFHAARTGTAGLAATSHRTDGLAAVETTVAGVAVGDHAIAVAAEAMRIGMEVVEVIAVGGRSIMPLVTAVVVAPAGVAGVGQEDV